jgi:hypothetical protein
MAHPFFINKKSTFQWFAYWLVIPAMQALVVASLSPSNPVTLVADMLVQTLVLAVISTLLWNISRFSNYQHFPQLQKYINLIAIGILSISLWILANYGLMRIVFDKENLVFIEETIYLRAFSGILLYIILMQHFEKLVNEQKAIDEENASANAFENEEESKKSAIAENVQKEVLEHIAVKSGNKLQVVMVADIIFLQADGDYVQIVTNDGKYLKEQTMKYFEEHLPHNTFVRVHRSNIVNIQAISRIELYEKQTQQLTLKNGHKIKISQAGYKQLRNKLNL